MNEIKYTNDGKKVVVVGNLNSLETIVQEIFVTNEGNEIPSGKNFVVESLHNSPVKSWKEIEIAKIEKRFESVKIDLEKEIEGLKNRHREKVAILKNRIESISVATNQLAPEVFKMTNDFLLGNFKYIVTGTSYSCPTILTWKEFEKQLLVTDGYYREIRYKGMKLLTLFGNRGSLQWKLNHYGDGSGSNMDIFPCYTYDEAKELALSFIKDKPYTENIILFLKKHNIPIDKKKLEEHNKAVIKCFEDTLKELDEKMAKTRSDLDAKIHSLQ